MTFQFKVQLPGICRPPVWRRLIVPGHFSFFKLHEIIQAAFGWQDFFGINPFRFQPKNAFEPLIDANDYEVENYFVCADDKFINGIIYRPFQQLDASETKLTAIFNSIQQKYVYTCGLGENWNHLITVEKITEAEWLRAACVTGRGACPPEDCGGSKGYARLKTIINDPLHMEHKEIKRWLEKNEGTSKWDAYAFDHEEAKKRVAAKGAFEIFLSK